VRSVLLALIASLAFAAAARAASTQTPSGWIAQAMCIHRHEGPWTANTGNGYFGGMQFRAATWLGVKGPKQAAFAHPGDSDYPFSASPQQQLRVALLIWSRDGGSWRSWGAVGAACS
jgi:transglycosylase-like protein